MNPNNIKEVGRDQPIEASHFNLILRALRYVYGRSTAIRNPYVRVKQNGSGMTFIPTARGGGGRGSGCKHWRYSLVTDPENPSLTHIKFIDGLINNVAADNLGTDIAIDLEADDEYIVAEVSATEATVESFTIVTGEAATSLTLEETETSPPSSFKINLGVVKGGSVYMFVCKNLQAVPVETRREASAAPYGEEPFDRWYRWAVYEEGDLVLL